MDSFKKIGEEKLLDREWSYSKESVTSQSYTNFY